MKKFLPLLPLGVFAAIGLAFWLGLGRDPNTLPSTLIDRPLPAFALAGLDGGENGLSTEDIVGEVALLNIFGSWCAGCRIEHPLLMEIARSGEVPIYGIDWKDEPGAGAAWLARYGDPYTRVGEDRDGRAAIELGVTGAPETFVIDKEGRVRYRHVGAITPEAWRRTLRPLVLELKRS